MDRMERAELTTLCLVEEGDRLLLQNRVKRDWQGYTLPGGHIEPGESIVEGAIREIREETGLTILDPQLVGIKQFPSKGGRYLVFLFRATRFTGELVSSEEGEMHWVDRADLPKLPTVNDFDELMQVMDDPALSEFQYVIDDRGDWIVQLR